MLNTSWKIFFAISTLVYVGGMIIWLVGWGSPNNALHQSALSWCFMSGIGVLAAIGVGASSDVLVAFMNRPK